MNTEIICPLCKKPYPDVTSGWYHNCLSFNVQNTGETPFDMLFHPLYTVNML